MENLIVLSKVKKHIKQVHGLSTSASFFEPLNKDIMDALEDAIKSAKSNGRKTVMGRDLNFFIADPKLEAILVVGSKTKAYIKEKSELSTSKQVAEQLSVRVEKLCAIAAENAKAAKRKTVMDRDYAAIRVSL